MDANQVGVILKSVLATAKNNPTAAMGTLKSSLSVIVLPLEGKSSGTFPDDVFLTSLELLYLMATNGNEKSTILSAIDISNIERLTTSNSAALRKSAEKLVSSLDSKSSTNNDVPSTPVTKRELRGIQLNMDGLLGSRDDEDRYIKALLLNPAITSVTVDRKREIALCYTYDTHEMKPELYNIVQNVADEIRDEQGKPRISVRAGDHAAYLEDDEDDEPEAEEGFFSGVLVTQGSTKSDASAADRLKNKTTSSGGWFNFSSWW